MLDLDIGLANFDIHLFYLITCLFYVVSDYSIIILLVIIQGFFFSRVAIHAVTMNH